MNKLLSIKIPVSNALEDMGIDIAKDIPTFTRWATDAEKSIGSYYSLCKKIEVIKVKHCSAKVPCDAAFIQMVLLGNFGCDCWDLFTRCTQNFDTLTAAVSDTFLIIDSPGTDNGVVLGGPKWEVQGGNIVFTRDYDNQYITIQYLGLKTDEDGFVLVGENHVEAIVNYIMYKYAVRSRFSPDKMDHGDKAFFWREWMRLSSSARADDGQLSDSDRQEIVSMIHDPYIGYGLEVGMNNKNDY